MKTIEYTYSYGSGSHSEDYGTIQEQHTYDSRLKVDEDSTWYMFASSRLTKECIEGVVTSSNGLITWHLTIRLDSMFKAVQLPACIAHLHTGLANMD